MVRLSAFAKVKKALDFCEILGSRYIRIFSYYIPEGHTHEEHRAPAVDWLGRLIAEAEELPRLGDKARGSRRMPCLKMLKPASGPHSALSRR